ncbi:MAG: SRPBCC family protein [Acidimicrobiia bacterium]
MVKYADSPSTSVDVHIDASAAVVWPLVCDINTPSSYSTEFQRAEWIDDGPALGATFRGHNHHERVGDWSVVCTITAFEPERIFEWSIGDGDDRSARWRFELEPSGAGSTLSFGAEMGPGPSGLTPAIERAPEREEDIVARRLTEWTDNMRRTVEGIKAMAENPGS